MPRIYGRSSYVLGLVCMLVVLSTAATACGPEAAQSIGELALGLSLTAWGGVLALILLLLQIPPA